MFSETNKLYKTRWIHPWLFNTNYCSNVSVHPKKMLRFRRRSDAVYNKGRVLIIKEIVKQAIVNIWCHFIFILTYLCCLIAFFVLIRSWLFSILSFVFFNILHWSTIINICTWCKLLCVHIRTLSIPWKLQANASIITGARIKLWHFSRACVTIIV